MAVACTEPGCSGSIAADGYCDTCGAKATLSQPAGAATPSATSSPSPSVGPAGRTADRAPGSVCGRDGCSGTIAGDGYCDTCGLAAQPASMAVASPWEASGRPGADGAPTGHSLAMARVPDVSSRVSVGADGDSPSRRTSRSRRTGTARSGIGVGLVTVEPTTVGDPAAALMSAEKIQSVLGEMAEEDRFCTSCGKPVGRSHDGRPGRVQGFCGNCRADFDFVTNAPALSPRELVAGQYEILGPLAHGGMGWIYLGRDRAVSDRWVVLKGLLNRDDPDAAAAAVAERRFLAQIEHANIVNIYNFVGHRGAGYIVMEMVGGESLNSKLKKRRAANGGVPDPLPVTDAIAYILGVLPAFEYLHNLGLVYNDLKPANIMAVGDDVKLIDVGAVMRIDDTQAAIFGTEGFQAPEVAERGPSVASDLYTVGRTLAVLIIRFTFHHGEFQHALPSPTQEPLFARWESMHRFLLKATAPHPDDRFASAAEMQEQLTGVLREIVAVTEGRPRPSVSHVFEPDRLPHLLLNTNERFDPTLADWRILPPARVHEEDPTAVFLLDLPEANPVANAAAIRNTLESGAVERSHELLLRYSWELIQVEGRERDDRLVGASARSGPRRPPELGTTPQLPSAEGKHPDPAVLLDRVEHTDPWDWRSWWYRAILDLIRDRPADAAEGFGRVWTEVPGETAPKVAVALAAELAGETSRARQLYDLVSTADSSYVSAAFGLARCNLVLRGPSEAVEAFGRVPASSAAHYDAQVAAARTLATGADRGEPTLDDLTAASETIERLELAAAERAAISAEIFERALTGLQSGRIPTDLGGGRIRLLGRSLDEDDLRKGLEDVYRIQARLSADQEERVALLDQANRIRPWSVF